MFFDIKKLTDDTKYKQECERMFFWSLFIPTDEDLVIFVGKQEKIHKEQVVDGYILREQFFSYLKEMAKNVDLEKESDGSKYTAILSCSFENLPLVKNDIHVNKLFCALIKEWIKPSELGKKYFGNFAFHILKKEGKWRLVITEDDILRYPLFQNDRDKSLKNHVVLE